MSPCNPICVMSLACATNLTSALLLAPGNRNNVVMAWAAGYPTNITHLTNTSFTLAQDVNAAQVLFSGGVALVDLSEFYVGQQLTLSQADIDSWIGMQTSVCEILSSRYKHNILYKWYGINDQKLDGQVWSIWDMINGAWLLDPGAVASRQVRAPHLSDDKLWGPDENGQ